MKKTIFLLSILLILSCSSNDKNKQAKQRLINGKDKNPYVIKVENLKINNDKLDKNMNEFEKALFMSYSYIHSKLGGFKAKVSSEIIYSRAKKLQFDDFDKKVPNINEGASDKKMPPVYNNVINLKQEIDFEHSVSENFSTKIKNNMGYSKEIRWINEILFVKSNREKFSYRKSIEDEHVKYKEESIKLLKEFFKLNDYKFEINYSKSSEYENKKVKVYTLSAGDKSYKNKNENKKIKIKITACNGEIFLDENHIPLKIDIYIKSSSIFKEKEIIKEFKYSRKIYDIGKKIDIKTPENTFVSVIPPSEEDAEEKILSFKKGHSAIEKLRKKKEKYEKIIGKTK